jgi:hypothetical protein
MLYVAHLAFFLSVLMLGSYESEVSLWLERDVFCVHKPFSSKQNRSERNCCTKMAAANSPFCRPPFRSTDHVLAGSKVSPSNLRARLDIKRSMKPSRPRVCGPPLSRTILTAPSRWRFAMLTLLIANLTGQYFPYVSHVGARSLTSSYTNITALATVASSKEVLTEIASRSDCKQSSLYCKES